MAGRPSARVAYTCGDGVDRELDAAFDQLVVVTVSVSPQEVNLHYIQGVEVGIAVAQAVSEERIDQQADRANR